MTDLDLAGRLRALMELFESRRIAALDVITSENAKGIYSNDWAFLKEARVWREAANEVRAALADRVGPPQSQVQEVGHAHPAGESPAPLPAAPVSVYSPGVPALELCFDTDVLNVWDGATVAQFRCRSLSDLAAVLAEVLSPEYDGCPIYTTLWHQHFTVRAAVRAGGVFPQAHLTHEDIEGLIEAIEMCILGPQSREAVQPYLDKLGAAVRAGGVSRDPLRTILARYPDARLVVPTLFEELAALVDRVGPPEAGAAGRDGGVSPDVKK